MGKKRVASGSGGGGMSGGMSNLGFFGGVGSYVSCDSDDTSFFCQLSKFTSMIQQFISLIGLLILMYVVYKYVVGPSLFKNKSR